jgi:catechol 2,3-dioxygenase-like lactoylglutathione lyase family enzyme
VNQTYNRFLPLILVGGVTIAAGAAPQRPPIVGVANIALKVGDLEKARNFYGHVLGYSEAFQLKQEGDAPAWTCFKVNDHQYIEVTPELKSKTEDRLVHIGFETADAQKLRDYLASKGIAVPAKANRDAGGNLSFTVKDPDAHDVEFVQYLDSSIHGRSFGKLISGARISDHILHVGIQVADRAAADRFYQDILGFRLLWAGGPTDEAINWVSMLVPDGTDWVEYMLNTTHPTPRQLGGMHHLCLGVMDVQTPYRTVVERGYRPPREPSVARDGRWLAHFFDPDLTRTEIMIRKPVQTPCCTPMHDPVTVE